MRQIAIAVRDGKQIDMRDIREAIESGDAVVVSDTVVSIAPKATPPSLLQRAANFATSAARHVAAGMPHATQQHIDARFAICQGCEHFDGRACRLCGCPVVREQQFVSKLSWANEKCPAGKWGPVTG
jgi:hypothetical protein